MAADNFNNDDTDYAVGYRRPPLHTRFRPGVSGNPSGRPKGAQNFKTLFEKILKEQISLREGEVTKKISKAEAIMRSLVIGALKGDTRSQMTLFKVAEQTGQFFEEHPAVLEVTWLPSDSTQANSPALPVPAIRRVNRD